MMYEEENDAVASLLSSVECPWIHGADGGEEQVEKTPLR